MNRPHLTSDATLGPAPDQRSCLGALMAVILMALAIAAFGWLVVRGVTAENRHRRQEAAACQHLAQRWAHTPGDTLHLILGRPACQAVLEGASPRR